LAQEFPPEKVWQEEAGLKRRFGEATGSDAPTPEINCAQLAVLDKLKAEHHLTLLIAGALLNIGRQHLGTVPTRSGSARWRGHGCRHLRKATQGYRALITPARNKDPCPECCGWPLLALFGEASEIATVSYLPPGSDPDYVSEPG
jgi:hypothetical protein